MGNLTPKDIVRYQKDSYPPIFATIQERTKEAPWGDTWKIRIWGQYKSLQVGEDLLTPTESPPKIPTNLEELEKYEVGANLTREDMAKLWSTEQLLGLGRQGNTGLVPKAETWLFQIPTHTIQAGDNNQESQQDQKTPLLCNLFDWKVPQEAIEYQRKTLRPVNQEKLGDQTQGRDLN